MLESLTPHYWIAKQWGERKWQRISNCNAKSTEHAGQQSGEVDYGELMNYTSVFEMIEAKLTANWTSERNVIVAIQLSIKEQKKKFGVQIRHVIVIGSHQKQ